MKQSPPLDAAGFACMADADDAAIARLSALLEVLQRWQARINLVGPATLADPWRRHILDSAQLIPLLPAGTPRIVDLGTGAGFPGMVIAILTGLPVTLVDSDRRKCAFLIEAARITGTTAEIHPARIEAPAPDRFEVVTARALAPLPKLLALAEGWLAPDGICLLLKGRGAEAELTDAGKRWKMRATSVASRSDPGGLILRIEGVSRREC